MLGPGQFNEWEGNMIMFSNLGTSSRSENVQSELCEQFFDFSRITAKSISAFREVPQEIVISIDNDVPVHEIHSVVRSKAIFDKRRELELEQEILKYENIADRTDPQSILYTNTLRKREIAIEEYTKIREDFWPEYTIKAIPILNKYVKVMSKEANGILSSGNDKESRGDVEERLKLIYTYIDLVNSLGILGIDTCYLFDTVNLCPGCQNPISDDSNDSERRVCSCGYVEENIFMSQEQNEISEGGFSKPSNESLVAFMKWLNRDLGISGEVFPEEEMFVKFDSICSSRGWPTGEMVRSGRVEQPDLERLTTLMSESGYSLHFKIKNIIRHRYWGWVLPVLSEEQLSQMKNDYILTQSQYPKYAMRKQNLNSEIRGYYHYRAVGVERSFSDFKIPMNPKTVRDANEVWENICLATKVGFFPIPM